MGAGQYQIVDKPLSPGESSDTYGVPLGSTIYQLDNGVTKVYGPDNKHLLSAKDADSNTIFTPNGPSKATHVHHVPRGSYIETIGNITKVYKSLNDKTCILTVVNQNKGRSNSLPPDSNPTYWIEWAGDGNIDDFGWTRAEWDCPSEPPSPSGNVINHIFNGITDDEDIIQPVLSWNYGGSDSWTGRAWYGVDGEYFPDEDPVTDISEGDDIWGVMYRSSNVWYVYFINQTTVETSWIASYNHPDADDLVFQVVLEGPNVLDDDDVCGDIEFHDMVFKDDSNDDIEGIELIPNINPYYDIRLSNLDVDCDQSAPIDNSWATLYTDN